MPTTDFLAIPDFTRDELARLRAAAPLLRYTILSDQLRTQPFTQAELLATRSVG